MADNVTEILNKSDNELLEWLVSNLQHQYAAGAVGSDRLAEAVLTMRATVRNTAYTKHLAVSAWAIAAITLITQVALLVLTLKR
jgi:hypothetical protein